jgi:spermidine/putrescine transport system permease protein
MNTPASRLREWLVTLPSLLWLVLFFVIPCLLIFGVMFRPPTPDGGVGPGWTLSTIADLGDPNYPAIIWRTLWLSALATIISLALALPCGYYLARLPVERRHRVLLAIIIPFWTNFLIRVFAWKVLLHPEGAIKKFLVLLHMVDPGSQLMYRPEAVLMVMVYTSLPFAILPIYAAAEKFDFHLLEAARDLGATKLQAFVRVFVPGISQGLITASLLVFIPDLGSYVIPDIMGGPTAEMVGNKIAQRVFTDRNLPHAAALSALLMLTVLLPMLGVLWNQRRQSARDRKGVSA